MITVYEAMSSIDANIVQDILSIEGINSHIMGAYLEGSIGEIQPMGLVRVMTDEKDFQAAKKIIAEWESEKPEQSTNKVQLIKKTYRAEENTYKKPLLGFTITFFILFFYFLSLR